jgi:hypothetical protein
MKPKKTGNKKRLFLWCFLLSGISLFARDIEITVQDKDLGIPLEGATIHSWDGTECICDVNGTGIIAAPDDVQVVVRISYPGYENARIIIPPEKSSFTVNLSLGGVLESQELVIEGRSAQETHEVESGRSITISGKELAKTAEIGLIEDVMTSIKLLPGVGYAGFFNALPSIRGGAPGDLTASFDGFYVENPFHWGGGFSIFDPKMVESAKLSHGVFSTRYGQTTSALLDITSKKPNPTETEFDLAISSSTANFSLSLPFSGKGGILFLGKVSYWDPFFALAKLTLSDIFPEVESIKTAPFIRSGAIVSNYRFSPNIEWYGSGFIGYDGVGIEYADEHDEGSQKTNFFWDNLIGFATTGLIINPANSMVLKTSIGAGFRNAGLQSDRNLDVSVRYSDDFLNNYDILDGSRDNLINGKTEYNIQMEEKQKEDSINSNFQGRIDYDWDFG